MLVHIEPSFRGDDEGEGGIRRVVEAQRKHLPEFGIEIVEDYRRADLVASHAGLKVTSPVYNPHVVHMHGLYWREYMWPRWSHRMNQDVIDAIRLADHVTAPSEWVAQALRRGMWIDPTVIHHGVDFEEWATGGRNGGYVLWNKNRPDPVCDPRIVPRMARLAPDLKFVTTFPGGDDPLPNVTTTGRLPFMAAKEIIKNAGVYLATTRETFGIGTLEAMAAGVPVVGWNWGGQREIITHREDGWLAEPNDFNGLLEGLRWAIDNRIVIGETAANTVRNRFTWLEVIHQYVDLYVSLWEGMAESYHRPAVSVIIPCHDLERFLPDTLSSLQRQSFEDWEAIIVDDCSPGNTQGIVSELQKKDHRFRYERTPENLYLAGALNFGIRRSKGRNIMVLDADNMIESDTLAILNEALSQDRGIDIAYGAARFVLEDGRTTDESVGRGGVSGWPLDFDFRGQMLRRNQIPSTCLFRRKVFDRTGGYRRRCRTAEDAEMWTRATSLGCVPKKVTNRPTLIYRQRESSMSRTEADWDWNSWFPWTRRKALTPFGAPIEPPNDINEGLAWNVPSFEPVMISVIIPVGPGHQSLVADAIDSVAGQTYQNWECIVINDTGGPLATGGDSGLPSWVHVIRPVSENDPRLMGPAAARNLAIRDSTGKLFLPLDADDYLQPEALEHMLTTYNQFGGVVYSQWWDDYGDRREIYDPPDYDANLLISNGALHAVTALYPKAAWEEVGGFDEDLSHWEDWDFQLRLANVGICGTKVQQPLFTYRKHTGMRREGNIADFEGGKRAILSRWNRLWDGKEKLMGCSGCPGGGGKKLPAAPKYNRQAPDGGRRSTDMNNEPGVTLVTYMGGRPNTQEWRGRESHTTYRFSSSPSNKTKWVFDADVPHLLALMDGGQTIFATVPQELQSPVKIEEEAPGDPEPAMVALGPPVEHDAATITRMAYAKAVEEGLGKGPMLIDEDDNPGDVPPTDIGAMFGDPDDPADKVTGDSLSTRELRLLVPEMSIEEVSGHLAKEKAGPNRSTAVTLLERRMKQLTGG